MNQKCVYCEGLGYIWLPTEKAIVKAPCPECNPMLWARVMENSL